MRQASTFEIVGQLGQELPGVLSVRAEGNPPTGQLQYRPLSQETLSQRIKDRDQQKPLLTSNDQSSMSLPGAQDKLGLRYDPMRNRLYDSVGSTPTTHIAKPDTRMVKFQPSAINEYLCMRLASAIKLPVAPVHLIQVPETVYIVQRYDRNMSARGWSVSRGLSMHCGGCNCRPKTCLAFSVGSCSTTSLATVMPTPRTFPS